ncbi:MAG TPA: peptidyl-dipeptidase Dcp [Vicinamibacterales bacterium]|nr:peptidyl-dipeptidase Dcp [Vicinamibacterales bacterium]
MSRNTVLALVTAAAAGAVALAWWSPAPATMTDTQTPVATRANPLLGPSPLPFAAPPFDQIQDADFAPAFEAGMKQQLDEVAAIADSPEPPTFDNTLVALERSGQLLTRVNLAFNALSSANTNPTLQALQEEVAPRLAALDDAIFLNDRLFKRVEAVYGQRDRLGLQGQPLRLAEYYYKRFVRAGARLSEADKTRLKALNEEDASLSAKFTNMLLAAAKAGALVTSNAADLAGLSKEEIQAASEAAKERGLEGRWVIPLQNTTQQPALASLTNRATRERLFDASWTRTERGDANDTRAAVARLAELRARRAELLGYPTHAAWSVEEQMAGTPVAVQQFLARLVPPAMANARAEARDIQALIDKQGAGFALAPWDWDFYAEQVRKARYDLNNAALAPYFALDRVLTDGVFYTATELYGLTFKERRDIPVYHPDVRVFEVFDHDGSPLALFYCDFFKRDNKNGGAWMDNFVQQSKLFGTKPVVVNVANFTKPAPGQPALLTFDEVGTLFHEFGHALHGIFADSQYPTLSGANVARDFVELPSQINEHWALDPKVLSRYAVHYQTGEPMPRELADKIRKAVTFNQGYALTELLASAALDMTWHSLPPASPAQDVNRFEASALEQAGVDTRVVPPRYRSSYFLHIWANGYDAGYYAYLWAEMLDNDAFQWFKENGGPTRANGDRFRAMILSRGNVSDYAKLYREFRGKDPSIEPMLKRRGIVVGK